MSFPVWLIISLVWKKIPRDCRSVFFIRILFRVFTFEVSLVKSLKDFRFQLLRQPFVILALKGGCSLHFSRVKSSSERRVLEEKERIIDWKKHLNEIIYTAGSN